MKFAETSLSEIFLASKISTCLTVSLILLSMASCVTNKSIRSTSNSGLRTVILNERDTISEKEFGKFTSWECKDFINGRRTLVEVGYFSKSSLGFGFILYDGSNTGEFANYQRAGLDHRWDWDRYSFIVKPDGTGLYYDFTLVPDGETTKAKDVFKCYQKR